MWGTDLTTTITGEGQATVFIAVDHCSAECVGIHAHRQATRFQALEPIRQGVRRRFGGFGKAIARGLGVRHDHGSQYMSHHCPEGDRLPRHREFARLRPGAGGQWLCRAVHPYLKFESTRNDPMARREELDDVASTRDDCQRCVSVVTSSLHPGYPMLLPGVPVA